jgi:Domain of unknown function (DUF4157)
MERQHLSQTKNAIAPPQPESAIARSSTHPIVELQGAIGNRAVNKLLANQPTLQAKPMFGGLSRELVIQPKLTIGAVGDKYEQEADRISKQVVHQINTPEPRSLAQNQSIQREEIPEDDDNELRMKPEVQRLSATDGMAATPDLEASIQQARSNGQPLGENIRQPMEKAFGSDFSGVKIHTNSQSDQLNQSIQAKAFTTGQDIFFRQGEYQPGSQSGKELLAHELTHVVQQSRGSLQGDRTTQYEPVIPTKMLAHEKTEQNYMKNLVSSQPLLTSDVESYKGKFTYVNRTCQVIQRTRIPTEISELETEIDTNSRIDFPAQIRKIFDIKILENIKVHVEKDSSKEQDNQTSNVYALSFIRDRIEYLKSIPETTVLDKKAQEAREKEKISDLEQDKFWAEAIFQGGKMYKKRVLLNSGLVQAEQVDGKVIYVLATSGQIYIRNEPQGVSRADNFTHANFLSGSSVKTAGQMFVRSGQVTRLDNESGHYKPHFLSLDWMLGKLLKEGVDLSNTLLVRNSAEGYQTYNAKNYLENSKPREIHNQVRIDDENYQQIYDAHIGKNTITFELNGWPFGKLRPHEWQPKVELIKKRINAGNLIKVVFEFQDQKANKNVKDAHTTYKTLLQEAKGYTIGMAEIEPSVPKKRATISFVMASLTKQILLV